MTKFVTSSLVAVMAMMVAPAVVAQDYPTRPITLVNPYAAGGSADLIARTLGEYVGRIIGQPVVVENRTGAGTAIAASFVAAAAPDGYTLLIAGSPTHVITPALNPDAGYDGIGGFEFISLVANVPNVLVVTKDSGIADVPALAARALEGADAVSYASVGNGSLPHLTGLMFSEEIGAQMMHIPYQGVAPATVDILAGNVDTGFMNAPALVAHIQSGDLIPLAVAATSRASQLPDVPTMGELGYKDYEMGTWYGISAPAGTPEAVVAKLDAAIAEVMQNPEVQARLQQAGVDIFYKNTADFESFLATDAEVVLGLIESSGVRNAQ
jgi:tripartite-type tricarboxylate transporter receptor subunit TctC